MQNMQKTIDQEHLIRSIEDLEAHYPGSRKLAPATLLKETPVVNDEYRKLIETAPFFALASVGPEGLDCSPRGDGPGFVKILDDDTLAFPDRRGNNRLDTLRNIVRDPRIAMMFLIPGWNECLRVNGTARISADPDLLEAFAVDNKLPATVILIKITTMYFQCARAIIRAGLWDEADKVDPKSLPSAGQLVKSTMTEFDAEAYDAALPDRQSKTLY